MKKITFSHFVIALTCALQISTNLPAQENFKRGISIAINSVEGQIGDPEWDSWGYAKGSFHNFGDITNKSLSLSILPKYVIGHDVLVRFEFGITNVHLTNYYDANAHLVSNNPSSTIITDQSIKQKIFRFIPGIQWNFLRKNFIESYCGMNVSYLHYSDMKYHNHTETKSLQDNTTIDGVDDHAKATGGFAAGAGALAGFNIYLGNHISLGAELSYSLLYYRLGDTFSGSSIPVNNSSNAQIYSYTTSSYKGFQFSKILPSLNICAWF